MASPLSLTPSGNWIGNDGSWSSFTVQAGTPPQAFEVLLGTKVQNLWIPIADECARYNSTTCGSSRGVSPFAQRLSPGFQSNVSSTWEAIGIYELGVGRNLGITGNGFNGFDTIRIVGIELKHVPVIAYASTGFWVGQLGLLPTTLNFSDTISSASFLRTLKNEGYIPSLSYGYQAGASYRFGKVPASLILGGYDRSRATSPLTVRFDAGFALNVGMQDVVATNTFEGTVSLISTEHILAPIDSSIAELWLPHSICDRFESAFGLQYHEASGRYVLTDTIRNQLRQLSPTLAFTIGANAGTGGNTTIIRFPYSAFDLQAGFPIFAETTNYFPIRRAANESQYAIGRVFLQEAYLGVDWERGIFNLSQAIYADPMPQPDIVTIRTSTSNSTHRKQHLSGGAIGGIVIGCVVAVCLFLAFVWHRRGHEQRTEVVPDIESEKTSIGQLEASQLRESELIGSGTLHELAAQHGLSELRVADETVCELPSGISEHNQCDKTNWA